MFNTKIVQIFIIFDYQIVSNKQLFFGGGNLFYCCFSVYFLYQLSTDVGSEDAKGGVTKRLYILCEFKCFSFYLIVYKCLVLKFQSLIILSSAFFQTLFSHTYYNQNRVGLDTTVFIYLKNIDLYFCFINHRKSTINNYYQ